MKNQYSVDDVSWLHESKAMGGERFYVRTNYQFVSKEWLCPYEVRTTSEAMDYGLKMHKAFNKQKVK